MENVSCHLHKSNNIYKEKNSINQSIKFLINFDFIRTIKNQVHILRDRQIDKILNKN